MIRNERSAVLGRLSGVDARSMKSNDIVSKVRSDEKAACKRIEAVLLLTSHEAEKVCQQMVKVLQEADLTINFRANSFFSSKTWLRQPKGDGFTNYFHGEKSNKIYMRNRDAAEEKLFDYSQSQSNVKDQAVKERIQKFGSYNDGDNVYFDPNSRPIYAALNYAKLKGGAANAYGKSYAVLHDYVRLNATFLHEDSLDTMSRVAKMDKAGSPNPGYVNGILADQRNQFRLIQNMSTGMLRALYTITKGNDFGNEVLVPGVENSAYSYIEAHIQGGIKFSRDVKTMYISRSELRQENFYASKVAIDFFGGQNNIEIIYIN
jgi:hypothetical protein